MPKLLTKNFKIASAKTFRESIETNRANIFFFMGGPFRWPEEDTPPQPTEDSKYYSEIYDNIIAAKRIGPLDVKNVVRRVDWKRNTIYAEYDDQDKSLLEKDFYVLNSEFNVYKCISNNNGKLSTVEPKGTPLLIFGTSDGYRWKFMYTINPQDQLRFLTKDWMPVTLDETVKRVALDGGIESVKINTGGINYSTATKIEVDGDQESKANIFAKVRLGSIFDYQIVNSGRKYRNAETTFSSFGAGRLANVRAIISPVGGHGYDPIKELGSNYLMFNIRTEVSSIFPTQVKFRQIGILNEPKLSDNFTSISNTTISFTNSLFLNNVNGAFIQDEYLVGEDTSSNMYCILANSAITSNVATLTYIQGKNSTSNFISPNVGETLIGTVSGASGQVAQIRRTTAGQDFGDILYIENISPITRGRDQTENLHLVIEF